MRSISALAAMLSLVACVGEVTQSAGGSPDGGLKPPVDAGLKPPPDVGVGPPDAPGPPPADAPVSGDSCGPDMIGTPPACFTAPPVAPESGKQWKISFSEEFDGTSLDTAKLTPCFDWNSGGCTASFNTGREKYMPSQIVVSNGTAKMIAEPLSPPESSSACLNGQCTYKAGLLSTARPKAQSGTPYLYTFTYGYVEARVKFPATQGFFTAFWMLPADPTYQYQWEIDIVEILGYDPTTIYMTYSYGQDRSQSHAVNSSTGNNGKCPVKDYSTDWVRLGVDWQPDHIAWYIDGVKCDQFNGDSTTIVGEPMQIILNNMIDNEWERRWNVTLTDLTQVRQTEVDYIRVYQQQ